MARTATRHRRASARVCHGPGAVVAAASDHWAGYHNGDSGACFATDDAATYHHISSNNAAVLPARRAALRTEP